MICQVCKENHRTLVNKEWCDRSELEIENDYLKEENARLREALKSIASQDHSHHIDSEYWYKVGIEGCSEVLANDTQIAREALKGGE